MALNDDEFIRAMYGAKAVVEKKPSKTTVHIGKDNPNHTKKDLYDADFKAYAKRYAEDHNVKKSDIYVDYVKDATALGKSYLYSIFLKMPVYKKTDWQLKIILSGCF
ncbi:MAG: hypothetical protein ACI4NC_06145 [Succinivibrio sp.]